MRKSWPAFMLMILLLLGYTTAFSQKPVIRDVDKRSASGGEVVTLRGTFNSDITKVSVSFGAMRGDVQFVSDQLLEVKVPGGATYENISVADLTSGLMDDSGFPFLNSFGGNHSISAASLEGQPDFNSESGLYDLCLCDFDRDGRTDVATANDASTAVSILANTTPAPGLANISFNSIPYNIGTRSIHATCGDLNGDGKPDLVISEGGASGERVFILRNTSTGPGVFTFSIQSTALTGKRVKRTDIADLDNDGKPEIVITNQNGPDVTVLVNQSTIAAITFAATPLVINVPGAASTDGLSVDDMDGDGLPEIVATQFLTQTSNIFILENTSLPGNISLAYNQTLAISGTVVNLRTGDLDGDNKPEITATQLIGSGTISVFRNTTSGAMSFATPVSFATDVRPWGLDFGDIDGDGLPDIVIASLEKSVSVLNNKSTAGTLNFSTLIQPTTFINRHVAIGDVDNDAKPDVVFTSVDDNNNNILASKVSVLRNKSCLVPALDPAGPLTICTGFPLQLSTTDSRGTNYEWKNGATTVANGANAFFDVTTGGSYTVTATGENGACMETSNAVSVSVDPGTTSGTAIAVNNGPVCIGSALSLSVNDVSATEYNWSGPDGYAGTGLNPAPLANFQETNAGRYYLDVIVNGCIAQQTSTVVETISAPDFTITYSGSDVICPPDTKVLNVFPIDPDFTYQWAERTSGDIAGATGPTFSVTSTGQYYVKAQSTTNPACAAIESDAATITFSTPPVADFTAPLEACTSQVIDFTNQSTGAGALTRYYQWSFGSLQTSTAENPAFQFTTPDTYNVTLRVSYNNGACADEVTKAITIEAAPSVSITTSSGNFAVCPGGTLALGVNGTFASYQWSSGEITSTIAVTLPGNYFVDVSNGTCIITAAVTVDAQQGPVVTATANPVQVTEGESSQLMATGLANYLWDPAATLDDAAIADPVATPAGTTVYTVQGTDDNGCPGSATVEVSVKGDFIVNKLRPSKFISPDNGDAINPFWVIENILNYPQCSVTIYDDKGVRVYDAKPYNNDWDGTFRGKQLPDGVYYYIIRCDGEENNPRSGSITVLR